MMLAARSSLRRIPPDSRAAWWRAAPVRSNAARSSPARCLARRREWPSRRPSSSRFSSAVRSVSTDANCPVRLTRFRTAAASRTTSWPSTRAVPPSGRSSVARMRIVVVLPAPFGPRTPKRLPRGMARFTPSTARVAPKVLTSPSVSTARSPIMPGDARDHAVSLARLGHMDKSDGQAGRTTASAPTREKLMAAAAELIAELGWGRVTTRAVAERAGLPHGAVSYHFRGKQELLTEAAMFAFARAIPADEFAALAGVDGLIGLISAEVADRDAIDPVLSRLMFEAMREAERDAALRERMGAMLTQYRELIIQMVRAEQERGTVFSRCPGRRDRHAARRGRRRAAAARAARSRTRRARRARRAPRPARSAIFLGTWGCMVMRHRLASDRPGWSSAAFCAGGVVAGRRFRRSARGALGWFLVHGGV